MSLPNLRFSITAIDQFSGVLAGAQTKLGGFGGAVSGFGRTLTTVATQAAGMFTAMIGFKALNAVQTFVRGSIESFTEFEQKLKAIQVFAGITADEASRLGETLLDMSARSVFTVTELEDAMINLARAGIIGDDAMTMLSAGMTGAMAAGEGLESTVSVALQAVRAFGFEVSESAYVMDVLINAANVSQASVSDLGTALGYVGPVAASAGISFTDLSTAVAYLTNVGFEATMAGTYLRGILNDLLDPTKAATTAIEALGIQIYDSQGALKPLPDIINAFRDALSGLGSAEVTSALMQVFDIRPATAMAALINMNEQEWNELSEAVRESGVASTQAAEMMDTHAGAMKRMQAAVEAARVELGTALAPLVLKLTELFMKFLPIITQVAGGLAEFAGRILDYIGPAVTQFAGLLQDFANSPAWQDIVSAADDAFGAIQQWLQEVASDPRFQEISNNLNSIISTGIDVLDQAIGDLRSAWDSDWGGMATTMGSAGNFIGDMFSEVSGDTASFANNIRDGFDTIVNSVRAFVEGAGSAIESLGYAVLSAAKTIQDAFNSISNTISNALTGIVVKVKRSTDLMKSYWEGTLNRMRQSANEFYNDQYARSLWPDLMEGIVSEVKGGLDIVKHEFEGLSAITPTMRTEFAPTARGRSGGAPPIINVSITGNNFASNIDVTQAVTRALQDEIADLMAEGLFGT